MEKHCLLISNEKALPFKLAMEKHCLLISNGKTLPFSPIHWKPYPIRQDICKYAISMTKITQQTVKCHYDNNNMCSFYTN